MASLSSHAGEFSSLINEMARPKQPQEIRQEAARILKRAWNDELPLRPRQDDLKAWDKLVGTGGDVDAGRRVFFRTTCVNCHAHSGRGTKTGPDLTSIAGSMSSERVLESILYPSKEIGPLYVPWRVLTVNGQVLTGLKLDKSGVGNSLRFQGADGMTFEVLLPDIEAQNPLAQSIMPSGLENTMSVEELRDLVAFLIGKAK
jgi:putative heme-binding domain-containing protein